MSLTVPVPVQGLAELDKVIKSLPTKIEVNVLRGALRAGQKVVQQAAVANAPVQSGELRSSVRVELNSKAARRGVVRMDLKAGGKMAWYSHIIEKGSGAHYAGAGRSVRKPYKIKPKKQPGALLFGGKVRETVTHPGVKPRLFMTHAAEKLDGPALDAFVAYVRKRLPREVAKHGSAPSA